MDILTADRLHLTVMVLFHLYRHRMTYPGLINTTEFLVQDILLPGQILLPGTDQLVLTT